MWADGQMNILWNAAKGSCHYRGSFHNIELNDSQRSPAEVAGTQCFWPHCVFEHVNHSLLTSSLLSLAGRVKMALLIQCVPLPLFSLIKPQAPDQPKPVFP
ncbi:unnamed protein product [Pipistrellus nathusii]|uniref:Uncharacterized protein n=1 Tax=Pipistrellus nathusii TaxID=59473 RepID=A0ABP0AAP4_PIPNA